MNKLATIAAWLTITAAAVGQTTFSGTTRIGTDWEHTKTFSGGTVRETFSDWRWAHTSGTNANQMSSFVRESVTLAAGATNVHALTNMVNSFGDTINFDVVRFFRAESASTNTATITIGNATNATWLGWCANSNDVMTLGAGGVVLLIAPAKAGYAVTDANNNLQFVNNGTNNAVYELYLGGSQ